MWLLKNARTLIPIKTKLYLYPIKTSGTYRAILLVLLMGLSVSLKSQSNLAKPLFLYSGTNKPFTIDQPAFLLSSVKEKNDIQMMLSPLTHVAFFCKMEDRVYNKLNVWIKLRAGSDEIYRKMIATP